MKKIIKKLMCGAMALCLAVPMGCSKKPSGDSTSEGGNPPAPPVEQAQYTLNETISKLSSSAYSNSTLTDDGYYGLSDISNVGVNEVQMGTELYPIVADGCTVIAYEDCAGSTGFEKFDKALEEAKALNDAGKKAIIDLPENGEIIINSSEGNDSEYTYRLRDYNGVYIRGNGCKILLDYDDFAHRGFVCFENCKDIRMQGFTVDYVIPTTVCGVITDIDMENYTVTFDVDEEFNTTMQRVINANVQPKSYVEFSGVTKAPKEGGNFCTASEGFLTGYTYKLENNVYTLTVSFGSSYYGYFSNEAIGDYANLAFSMYVYNGFAYYSCENVYMEDVTLNTIAGMGVVGNRSTNLYFNRVDIELPENSNRLMTVTADGFHFAECFGDVEITNSIIEYTHDDALNVKSGYYYGVSGVDVKNKKITIARKTSGITIPEVGNVIELYDSNTFEKIGYGTVASVTGNEAAYVVVVEESLTRQGAGSWDIKNMVATNISKTAKFLFENNIVRNKRNRGLLIQVRDGMVRNNTFQNVGHGSVSIHSSLDVFNEATMPANITVENNKFINNNYLLSLAGDIAVFARSHSLGPVGTIKGIKVNNNFISSNGNAGVSLQSCGDSSITNNLFYNNGRVNSGETYECAVEMNNSGEIAITGNYAYNTSNSETYAGIITNGLTSPETITLTDNVNLAYQVIVAEVSTTEVAKLTSAVTVDGDVSDWAEQGTSVAMNGHSLATGAPIAPEEYADVFGIETCKIGWTDDGIYIAFKVRDNALDFKTQNNFWNGDVFELFYSNVLDMPNADFQLYRNNGDVAQFGVTPNWTVKHTLVESRTNDAIMTATDIRSACVTTSDGYAGELFLPFSVFTGSKTTIENGGEIALAFVFADNDRDDIGRKRLQVSNVPHFVENWKTKTAKMPLFKFV